MGKKIIVENCKTCPFLVEFYGKTTQDPVYTTLINCEFSGFKCSKLNKVLAKKIDDLNTIFKDCPLEDCITENTNLERSTTSS